MKIVKNRRFVSMFCYIFCGIYLFFAISIACINANILDARENDFNDLISYVNTVNKRVEEEKLIRKNQDQDNSGDNTPDTPLFSDGKTAFLTAYEKFYNSNSFVAKIDGTLSTNAIGIDIKISFAASAIRYNDKKTFNEFLIKYLDSTSMQSTMEQEVQYGKQIYKLEDGIRFRETLRVARKNGTLVGTAYGTPNNIKECFPFAENLMIINEETIQEITFFKIKEKNGKPQYYYVQAVLNPETAPVNFRNATAFNINEFKFGVPTYSKCVITACIDANGNLVGLTSVDTASVNVTGPVVGSLTAPCNYTYSYAISGINEEIIFVPEGF